MLKLLLQIFLQLPPGTRNPDDNSPIDFSNPFELVVYIILPILIVIFYIIWRKKKKNEMNNEN
ncbi:adenylosuccinate synthetase [Gaetbulibacter aestuarii]|uniref:Adenylosuccinate synthetase n=1 Tax=Gaetbulibacter aestuarii TaxID=1502358 RepID=A0ABW7MYW1_9FLAO